MEMSCAWDKLSADLQQSVLLRVHWHDLCPFRQVCKEWKHMIMEPEFLSLHATAPRPDSCIVTATRETVPFSATHPTQLVVHENDEWQFLDIPTNRMFSIPGTFVREGLLRSAKGVCIHRHTVAVSGGLIYAVYLASDAHRYATPRHVVFNPVSKSVHQIDVADAPDHVSKGFNVVAMVVETATQHYRLVHVIGELSAPFTAGSEPGEVHLYDSRVRVWRKLCDAPAAAHIPCSCVVLNGIFYVVFEVKSNRRHELYSCDLEAGEWRHIDVSLPRPPLRPQVTMYLPQVVAASGRLFFVGYYGNAARAVTTVAIWRITLNETPILTLVAQLPTFMSCDGLDLIYWGRIVVMTTGCGDALVVSNFRGLRVRWDVVRHTWFRSMPPFLSKCNGLAECHSFFVGTMDLDLRQMPPQ